MYAGKKYFEESLITLMDALCITISMLVAGVLRFGSGVANENIVLSMGVTFFAYLAVRAIFPDKNNLGILGYWNELLRVFKIHLSLFLATVAFLYISHQGSDISRLMLGYFYCVDLVLMYLGRLVLKLYLFKYYRDGTRSRRMLVLTDSGQADDVIVSLRENLSWDFKVIGITVLDKNMTGQLIQFVPVVCDMDALIDYVKSHPVDEVFIRIDKKFPISMKKVVSQLESMGILVDVSIQVFDMDISTKKSINKVGNYDVVTFSSNTLTYQQLGLKRILDIIGAMFGILILALAFIVIGPFIKLDSPGPVFFKQTRVGKNGRYFQLYKFRSMYLDAEERKMDLMLHNQMNGMMFKMKDDPRITKVGKFIRKTSIDELPQFWNVLKGDMSLVGTRPPTLDEYQQYKPEYKTRLSLIPGLTGVWQVSGRNQMTDFESIVALDKSYIDNWSLKNDIKIIFQTIRVVFLGHGAS